MTTKNEGMKVERDYADSGKPGLVDSFLSVPRILRGLGAATLIAAVSIFLLQGWESGNDVYRYFLLLGHTVGLALLGILSSRWIHENKGARLLLALALLSVPANYAILGGFIFSQFGFDSVNVVYPAYVSWRTTDPVTALVVSGGAIAMLVPVIWLGFMVLSRRSATRFTLLYFLSNLLILVPLRETAITAWIVLGLAVLVIHQLSRAHRADPSLKTTEGLIARVAQFVPLGVLVGRSMWLYSADAFLITVLAILVFMIFRQITGLVGQEHRVRSFLDAASLIPAAAVGLAATNMAVTVFPHMQAIFLPTFSITFAILIMEIAMHSSNNGALYRRIAAAVVTLGMLIDLVVFGGVLVAAICFALGLAMLVYGYMVEQRLVFSLGTVSLMAGLLYQISYAFTVFDLGSWGSLAVIGITAILVGSAIERHGEQFKIYLKDWGQRFNTWEY